MTKPTNKILVVDDDPNISKLIRFYLKQTEYDIDSAADGKLGLQAVKKGRYDLLLLDMQMPHLDGITFMQTIGEIPTFETLIIVITAHDPDDRMMSVIDKYAFDYIQKPFTANRLRHTINNALRHKELQDKYTELIQSVIRG